MTNLKDLQQMGQRMSCNGESTISRWLDDSDSSLALSLMTVKRRFVRDEDGRGGDSDLLQHESRSVSSKVTPNKAHQGRPKAS